MYCIGWITFILYDLYWSNCILSNSWDNLWIILDDYHIILYDRPIYKLRPIFTPFDSPPFHFLLTISLLSALLVFPILHRLSTTMLGFFSHQNEHFLSNVDGTTYGQYKTNGFTDSHLLDQSKLTFSISTLFVHSTLLPMIILDFPFHSKLIF